MRSEGKNPGERGRRKDGYHQFPATRTPADHPRDEQTDATTTTVAMASDGEENALWICTPAGIGTLVGTGTPVGKRDTGVEDTKAVRRNARVDVRDVLGTVATRGTASNQTAHGRRISPVRVADAIDHAPTLKTNPIALTDLLAHDHVDTTEPKDTVHATPQSALKTNPVTPHPRPLTRTPSKPSWGLSHPLPFALAAAVP